MATSDHRRRLQQQLTELATVERPRLLGLIAEVDGKDPADLADRAARELDLAQIEARIQRLTDLLEAGAASERASAGAAGDAQRLFPGATLVLDFGDGPETYRYSALDIDDGIDVVTPDSPLGHALAGAVPGEPITYRTPRGEASVTLLSVGAPAAA